ncbi:thioredoxin fold domain-containing protein [Acidithiobacillus ferrooxidans]|uniref:thioredoxin fold domain-containing protein n=1 Tax=Acidithiobacillus ferrooxidans TaxID=920 RepID=UPI001D001E35|nr:thioredoxin fold domain-containing protein [Acidithiobacillus ferrooxidans]
MWTRNTWMKWGVGLFLMATGAVTGISVAMAAPATHPQPKMTEAGFWKLLGEKLTFIQEGHKGPVIYDFFDPGCTYCYTLYNEEQPLIRTGQLTVRYVPVAYLLPSSAPEAAALLQSPNPLSALQHFEPIVGKSFGKPLGASGVPGLPSAKVLPMTAQELKENIGLLQSARAMGVPAILYDQKNSKVGLVQGMISRQGLITMLPHLQ